MEGIEKELQNFLNRADILKNEPMAKHTSFKIGGNAEYFIKVKSIQNLKKILILANIKNTSKELDRKSEALYIAINEIENVKNQGFS